MIDSMEFQTVGIISTGEMGSSIGRVLGEHGLRPITTVRQRSERTRHLATDAGVELVPDLPAVVRESDLLISTVPTDAAQSVAESVAEAATDLDTRVLLCDLNPLAPSDAQSIADRYGDAIDLIDGCILGAAHDVPDVYLYLAGPRADDLTSLEEYGFTVTILGEHIGQASGFKLCYGGISKGVAVIALDVYLGAIALGIEESLEALHRRRMPGVMEHFDSYLPRTPARAARWAEEMGALADTLESVGIDGAGPRFNQDRLEWLGAMDLDTDDATDAVAAIERVSDTIAADQSDS